MIEIQNVWYPWRLISKDGDNFTFECEIRFPVVPVDTRIEHMRKSIPSLIFEYMEDIHGGLERGGSGSRRVKLW